MSLAIDLTGIQVEICKAEREASSLLRGLKGRVPNAIYSNLQVQLCIIASEGTKFFNTLGAMRMTGDLEQRPLPVTAESLELAAFVMPPPHVMVVGTPADVERVSAGRIVPMLPEHELRDESAAFARELVLSGDDTLQEVAR